MEYRDSLYDGFHFREFSIATRQDRRRPQVTHSTRSDQRIQRNPQGEFKVIKFFKVVNGNWPVPINLTALTIMDLACHCSVSTPASSIAKWRDSAKHLDTMPLDFQPPYGNVSLMAIDTDLIFKKPPAQPAAPATLEEFLVSVGYRFDGACYVRGNDYARQMVDGSWRLSSYKEEAAPEVATNHSQIPPPPPPLPFTPTTVATTAAAAARFVYQLARLYSFCRPVNIGDHYQLLVSYLRELDQSPITQALLLADGHIQRSQDGELFVNGEHVIWLSRRARPPYCQHNEWKIDRHPVTFTTIGELRTFLRLLNAPIQAPLHLNAANRRACSLGPCPRSQSPTTPTPPTPAPKTSPKASPEAQPPRPAQPPQLSDQPAADGSRSPVSRSRRGRPLLLTELLLAVPLLISMLIPPPPPPPPPPQPE